MSVEEQQQARARELRAKFYPSRINNAHVTEQRARERERAVAAEEKMAAEREAAEKRKFAEERARQLEQQIRQLERQLSQEDRRAYRVGQRRRMPEILKAVATVTGVSVHEIESVRRTHRVVRARHVLSFMARKHTRLSTPAIGQWLGGQDHTTVLNGIGRIEQALREGDEEVTRVVAAVRAELELE